MSELATEAIQVGSPAREIRVGRWSPATPAKAVVLLLNGLTEFLEKYQEVADDLTARGLEVLSLDWGGQGLSHRLLENKQKIHTRDYADRLEEADALVCWGREVIGDRPVVLLGHSMGGHIALRFAAERPPANLRAIALSAPMIAFPPMRGLDRLMGTIVRLVGACGWTERYAPGKGDYDDRIATVRAYLMSTDTRRVRFQEELWPGEETNRLGGVTWGWLRASLDSCAVLRRPGYLEALPYPTLLALAGRDVLVSNRAARRAAARMPVCHVVRYNNAMHEILMERDETRDCFFADFDRLVSEVGI